MTPDGEYDFYAQPANQEPQGQPRRRTKRLTAPIPVRFPPELLAAVKRRADATTIERSVWLVTHPHVGPGPWSRY